MPGPLELVKNAAAAGGRVLDALTAGGAVTVSPVVREARLAVCQGCPDRNGARCDKCGCVLAWKAGLATERCPMRRWRA